MQTCTGPIMYDTQRRRGGGGGRGKRGEGEMEMGGKGPYFVYERKGEEDGKNAGN